MGILLREMIRIGAGIRKRCGDDGRMMPWLQHRILTQRNIPSQYEFALRELHRKV
jgi:hypothetical protein